MAMISRSSILLLVIFCFCATALTLVSKSRYSMAFSKSISSDAACIFSSSMEMTGSYLPPRKSRAWLMAFPYSSLLMYPWQGAEHCLMW